MGELLEDYSELFSECTHLKMQLDGKFLKASEVFIGDEYCGFTSTEDINEATTFVWFGKIGAGHMMAHESGGGLYDVVPLDEYLIQSYSNQDLCFTLVDGNPNFGWNASWDRCIGYLDDEECDIEYVSVSGESGKVVLWKTECLYCAPVILKPHYIIDLFNDSFNRDYGYVFRISLDGLYLRSFEDLFIAVEDIESSTVFEWVPTNDLKGVLKAYVKLTLSTIDEKDGFMTVGLVENDIELEQDEHGSFNFGFSMCWDSDGLVSTDSYHGSVILWTI
ncbi:hypothetical protein GQ42DRAFT_93123 [Ramicandelaber brevisporus]|nr:hypothetical protein GQ42DRAFT_93123 [Ramicandelaber brevisporus]